VLDRLAAEVVVGDLRDPASLPAAVSGVEAVVSTATAHTRLRSGRTNLTYQAVDQAGYLNLIAAAEQAGVRRFVFLSLSPRLLAVSTPYSDAKRLIEDRLRASPMAEVIVQSDLIQELGLAPEARFDWVKRAVDMPGRGESLAAYLGADNLAELMAVVASEVAPPSSIDVGGPEALSRRDAAALLERLLGEPVRRRSLPRGVMRAVSRLTRRVRPVVSTEFGLALAADIADTTATDRPLRDRGIEPRSVEAYLREAIAGLPSAS
jgi:uncharacterized protein YbjT (DUF2867 family)